MTATQREILANLVSEASENFTDVSTEWEGLKGVPVIKKLQESNVCVVSSREMEKLEKEIKILNHIFSNSLHPTLSDLTKQLKQNQTELAVAMETIEDLKAEKDHWHSRYQTATQDFEKGKQETFKLQCECQDVTSQLAHQTDYCANMGVACCTLLWRVSRSEESIQLLLAGNKVDNFLSLVTGTLESFMTTFKDDWPSTNTQEFQFIMALAGTITNIAASAYGRDFLMLKEQGRHLVDIFFEVLKQAPNSGQCSKLKNLILMCLYNISINQKGLQQVSSKPGLVSLLVWIIQDEKMAENRQHSLHLIQSLLCDDSNISIRHQANETISAHFLQHLANEKDKEIREIALELMCDLHLTGVVTDTK